MLQIHRLRQTLIVLPVGIVQNRLLVRGRPAPLVHRSSDGIRRENSAFRTNSPFAVSVFWRRGRLFGIPYTDNLSS